MVEESRRGLTTAVVIVAEPSDGPERGRDGNEATDQLAQLRWRVEANGGELVGSAVDGFSVVFLSARQALRFALASQRAASRWRSAVRIGISTGDETGSRGATIGGAVELASGVAGLAAAGEVLVSDAVRQLAGMIPTVRFVDRGRFQLDGLAAPWQMWAVTDAAGGERTVATIGRVGELAAVVELVTSTVAGMGRVLLLEGEPGIGKTHLLHEAMEQARRAGCLVVDVVADELLRRPGVVPHGLSAAAARSGLPERARLDELLNTARSRQGQLDDLRYAVIEASVDLLEVMARERPVLLAADDVQWADDLSISVLAALASRAGVSPFGLAIAMRPAPRSSALDRLVERIGGGTGVHAHLELLHEVEAVAVASALTGAAPGGNLRERLRGAAGNPLFVTELIRSLEDEGQLRVSSGVVDVADGPMPISLRETLVRRLSWLPAETRDLLSAASLLGSKFSLHELATITGCTIREAAAWLRHASVSGLIIDDRELLRFRHDLIREAVYGQVLSAERRDLHRAAGHALARVGASTQQISEQFARGAMPGDLEAIEWLERAAIESMSVAPSDSLTLLERALSIAPPLWPGRAALQTRMIEPLVWCGRFGEAERIANIVLATATNADVEYAALRGLSAVHGNRGDVQQAIETLNRAVAASGVPAAEALRLRCVASQLSLLSGTTSAAHAQGVAGDTLASGVRTRDPTTQCVAHQALGVIATVGGHAIAARDHLSAAVDLWSSGQVTDTPYLIPETFYAGVLLDLDALDDARTAAGRARDRATRHGKVVLLPMTFVVPAAAHFYAGRWDDAIAEVEAGLAVIEDTGDFNFVLYCEALYAKIALRRGDLATARSHLDAGANRLAERVSLFGADWLFGTQAELLAAQDQTSESLAVAEMTWAQTASIRYFFGHRQRGVFLVRLAVAAGRDELAESVTAELEEGARRSPAVGAAATALHSRGIAQRDLPLLIEATNRYRDAGLRPDLATCCEDAAERSTASGQRGTAIELLVEAASIYADLDAIPAIAIVQTALADLGVRQRQHTTRPTSGWEALTKMEAEVSRLVAQGMTNPEVGAQLFISRRTVETHLSHVYRKLDIPSRTHLVAELTRRNFTP